MYDHQATSDRFFLIMVFVACVAVAAAMLAGVTCVGASMQHRQAMKNDTYGGATYGQTTLGVISHCILPFSEQVAMLRRLNVDPATVAEIYCVCDHDQCEMNYTLLSSRDAWKQFGN